MTIDWHFIVEKCIGHRGDLLDACQHGPFSGATRQAVQGPESWPDPPCPRAYLEAGHPRCQGLSAAHIKATVVEVVVITVPLANISPACLEPNT